MSSVHTTTQYPWPAGRLAGRRYDISDLLTSTNPPNRKQTDPTEHIGQDITSHHINKQEQEKKANGRATG
jgi:hypothetical protein